MEELKNKLLDLDIVIDNDYLNKYITLIQTNAVTLRQRNKTQRHHIIPKWYYKKNNLPCDNSPENLVNLEYKDHILAHYYLEKCIKDSEAKGKNFFAIYKLCGSAKISKEELYRILEDEKLLLEFIRYKNYANIFSKDHREKLSKADKEMIYVYKNAVQTKIYPNMLDKYLADG